MSIYIQAAVSHYVKEVQAWRKNMTLRETEERDLSVEKSFTGAARWACKAGKKASEQLYVASLHTSVLSSQL